MSLIPVTGVPAVSSRPASPARSDAESQTSKLSARGRRIERSRSPVHHHRNISVVSGAEGVGVQVLGATETPEVTMIEVTPPTPAWASMGPAAPASDQDFAPPSYGPNYIVSSTSAHDMTAKAGQIELPEMSPEELAELAAKETPRTHIPADPDADIDNDEGTYNADRLVTESRVESLLPTLGKDVAKPARPRGRRMRSSVNTVPAEAPPARVVTNSPPPGSSITDISAMAEETRMQAYRAVDEYTSSDAFRAIVHAGVKTVLEGLEKNVDDEVQALREENKRLTGLLEEQSKLSIELMQLAKKLETQVGELQTACARTASTQETNYRKTLDAYNKLRDSTASQVQVLQKNDEAVDARIDAIEKAVSGGLAAPVVQKEVSRHMHALRKAESDVQRSAVVLSNLQAQVEGSTGSRGFTQPSTSSIVPPPSEVGSTVTSSMTPPSQVTMTPAKAAVKADLDRMAGTSKENSNQYRRLLERFNKMT